MPVAIDIVGRRFGRLVVLALHSNARRKPTRADRKWLCRCDCGELTVTRGVNLRSGNTKSCGCMWWETITTHGHCRTPEYRAWNQMIQRCTNPNSQRYSRYGGRGISVCQRWFRFENFLADMGPRPPGYSIERIDNDGNYEPSNCVWIPRNQQQRNQTHPRPKISG